jgi:hypothetical protein
MKLPWLPRAYLNNIFKMYYSKRNREKKWLVQCDHRHVDEKQMNKLQRKLKLVFSRRNVFFLSHSSRFRPVLTYRLKSFSQRSAGRNFADFSLRIFAEVILTRVGQETS